MRYQGRLSDWNDEKGYGFVAPNGGGDKAFVHIKAFAGTSRRPVTGDIVTYSVTRDAHGRLQATAIRFAVKAKTLDNRATPGWLGPTFAALFVSMLISAALTEKIAMSLLVIYAAMSAIAFIAYGLDKSAAAAERQRTPEATLHLLGLLCGWPGALLAQRVFKHKLRKREFLATYWGTVVINIIALLVFSSDAGRAWLGL